MMWTVLGFLAFAMVILILAACRCAVEEDELMKLHPPDDDDGISRLEDDPDGIYQR
ncbi:MAG: hypothetical protein IKE76_06855 [Clostridia bacterium]|nr:hypothetical protein [Clostridia bacterium]